MSELPVTAEFVDEYGYGFGPGTTGRRYAGEVRVKVAGHVVLRVDHSYSSLHVQGSAEAETEQAEEVADAVRAWVDRIEDVVREAEEAHR